ncbi:MAG TPA: GntR family transcriptional regulator [Pseudolysinimonas sp.]|nr:GntR family transcriptional regulator [Pseudolysinimonas sp.]
MTRHPPIRDQVASILRNAIVSLEFVPGQVLIERTLCEMTEASRPSVREALRQLEAEGLVDSQNGRGTIVRVVTASEAAQVYEVRAELEGLAARLFTQRSTSEQQDRLRLALDALKISNAEPFETARVLDAQNAFYRALFDGAGNEFLDKTVQGMQVRIAQLRALTLQAPGRAAASLREFERLAELLLAGDGVGAQQAASEHVHHAAAAMTSVVPS